MPLAGPILHFRGQKEDRWNLSALVVREGDDGPGPLVLDGAGEIAPERLAVHHGHGFWRYDLSLPLGKEETTVSYTVAGREASVALPPVTRGRRLAFAACSGTDDEERDCVPPSRNALWRQLGATNAR